MIDQLLSAHTAQFPETQHRILVGKGPYDRCYLDLGKFWKMASFIPHAASTSRQQALWVLRNSPLAEAYWKEVDVVYCPAESYVPVGRAKLVCTIHDVAGFEENLYPTTLSRRWHCFKWRMLFKRMAKQADAVVTVSAFSASRIAHFFPDLAPKLHVIHNAPHPVFGSACSSEDKAEVQRISEGSPYILVPGGLSIRKNADLILRSIPLLAQEMPEVKLILAGSNTAAYVQQLDTIEKKNIILAGYVSDELLNALYQHAAVVWFPSRYEGFGMPVIEAMAAGAPVVTSNASSIPEVVGDAALLCDIDRPEEHVEAIRSVIESNSIRREICARSRDQASRFTWDSSAQKLENLFQSLAGNS